MFRVFVSAHRYGVSRWLLLRLGRDRVIGVREGVRLWVLQESRDCNKQRKVPWLQNALVFDWGHIRILKR